MAVKNRQAPRRFTDYALASTPTEDMIHGEPTLNFDYTQIAEEHRAAIMQHAKEIKRAERRAVATAVQIGRNLLTVQVLLPHGQFLTWIEQEFSWSQATAYQMINLAKRFPPTTLPPDNIGLTALYQLTGPTVPASALEEAQQRAATGEIITTRTAQTIARAHRNDLPTNHQPAPPPSTPTNAPENPTSTAPQPAETLRRALPYLHDARALVPATYQDPINSVISTLLHLIRELENRPGSD